MTAVLPAMFPRLGRVLGQVAVITLLFLGCVINVGQHAPPGELSDLGSFLHAGSLASDGLNPYGPYAHGINLNAPLSVLPFQLAAKFNPETVYTRLYVFSLCMYAVVLLLLWRAYPKAHSAARLVWALVWGSLWSSLWDGQIYVALTLVTTGAWLLITGRHHIGAGVLIGLLCAIKPNYLVWPVLLALSGTWVVALTAGFAIISLSAIPAIVYGPSIYRQWFLAATQVSNATQPGNASLAGALARFNAPAWIGLIACVLLLLGMALWALKTKPEPVRASGAALAAAILASPLGWVDYTLLLLPAFWSHRWTWPWWCAALMLLEFMGNTWWMLRAPPWVLASLGQYGTAAVLLVLLGVLRGTFGVPNVSASDYQREMLPHRQHIAVKAF